MTLVPWQDELLEWHEAFRYRDLDGVVHRSLVTMIGGPDGNTRWWGCHLREGAKERVPVPPDTLVTCIACLARGPVATAAAP
jgi:hypothetical protein